MKALKYISILITSIVLLAPNLGLAGKLWFSPDSWTYIKGCPFEIDIMVDTKDIPTTTIDVKIMESPNMYVINKFNYDGGIFRAYSSPIRGTALAGEMRGSNYLYFLGTTASEIGFAGEGRFGTLTITPRKNVNEIDLDFYFVDNLLGDDSNIAHLDTNKKMHDLLQEAPGATYQFVDGTCPPPEEFNLIEVPETPGLSINTGQMHALADGGITTLISRYSLALIIATIIIIAIFYNFFMDDRKKKKNRKYTNKNQ